MRKIRCAVLGATGVVGQHFLKLLVDHPYFELVAICASDARAGQKLHTAREHVPGGLPKSFSHLEFDPIDVAILKNKKVDIVFSALPADVAQTIEKEAAKNGINVFSNASAYRMDSQVPILIPEVNHEHIDLIKAQKKETPGFIITNANCTTTGLAMALAPIQPLGIKKLIMASYQAISGAGYPGLPTMDILTNVIPYIGGEEPKVLAECAKIFGKCDSDVIKDADWEIHAHCVRVQTIVGHLISVHLELEKEVKYEEVLNLIKSYKAPEKVAGLPTAPVEPVLYTDVPTRPQPMLDINAGDPQRAAGMAVTIGRLEVKGNIVRFLTLSNNLVRGAAGGSILNAELAYQEKLI